MGRPLKDGKIKLTDEEKNTLQRIRKSKTENAIRVKRAIMLLLADAGKTLTEIGEKVDFHFSAVKLCLKKYRKGGIEAALTIRKFQEHIRKNCAAVGHSALHQVSISTLSEILNEASLKPHRIRYYLERRDEEKMEQVLIAYKKVQLKLAKKLQDDCITISYDEKPGIQATANTVDDRNPTLKHGFTARDSEYKRLGTLSLLAGINLEDGEVISIVRERHASDEFIEWLKVVDEKYDRGKKIIVILDNHSVHRSAKTNDYLETRKERFDFVFTPKHGSWLNIIEGFFGKFSRQCLRGLRVKTKDELKERILKYMDEVNENPVIPHWTYKMDEISIL